MSGGGSLPPGSPQPPVSPPGSEDDQPRGRKRRRTSPSPSGEEANLGPPGFGQVSFIPSAGFLSSSFLSLSCLGGGLLRLSSRLHRVSRPGDPRRVFRLAAPPACRCCSLRGATPPAGDRRALPGVGEALEVALFGPYLLAHRGLRHLCGSSRVVSPGLGSSAGGPLI